MFNLQAKIACPKSIRHVIHDMYECWLWSCLAQPPFIGPNPRTAVHKFQDPRLGCLALALGSGSVLGHRHKRFKTPCKLAREAPRFLPAMPFYKRLAQIPQ